MGHASGEESEGEEEARGLEEEDGRVMPECQQHTALTQSDVADGTATTCE